MLEPLSRFRNDYVTAQTQKYISRIFRPCPNTSQVRVAPPRCGQSQSRQLRHFEILILDQTRVKYLLDDDVPDDLISASHIHPGSICTIMYIQVQM